MPESCLATVRTFKSLLQVERLRRRNQVTRATPFQTRVFELLDLYPVGSD
jgi:hypothetical protein